MSEPDERQARAAAGPPPRLDVTLRVGDASIPFKVADDPDGSVFFGLGVRKSGSTMLHRTLIFLAVRNRVNVVDIPGAFFRQGFTAAHWEDLDVAPLLRPGNIYTGFRNFPTRMARSEAYRSARKVFMFRDPRDALVSQYFSDAYSHSLPPAEGAAGDGRELFEKKRAEALQADIDEWVVQKAGSLRKTLLGFAGALEDARCLVLRYEDYVFQKRRMAHKIIRHFGWTVAPPALETFMAEIDIVPEGEDQRRFVRKAVPGDHNAKLKPETIRRLNRQLADVMDLYDYH